MRIGRQGLQPVILQRFADREMVQALPGLVLQAQHAVYRIVEETTDAGTTHAGGLRLQIQNLAE